VFFATIGGGRKAILFPKRQTIRTRTLLAPSRTTTEEETNWLSVAVSPKLGGNCEKTMVVGEIELSIGTGRALPQRGFSAFHPGRSKSMTSSELRRPIR
jgi:hypothetical protein